MRAHYDFEKDKYYIQACRDAVCFPLGHILSLFCACSEKKELHFFSRGKKKEGVRKKHRKYSDLGIKDYHREWEDDLLAEMTFEDPVYEPRDVLDSEGNYIKFAVGTKFRKDGRPINTLKKEKTFGKMKEKVPKELKIPMSERIAEKRIGKEIVRTRTLSSHRAEKATEKDRDLDFGKIRHFVATFYDKITSS